MKKRTDIPRKYAKYESQKKKNTPKQNQNPTPKTYHL